jgi:TRAP-type C4-dicarboxylate transport system substrate-binding protein
MRFAALAAALAGMLAALGPLAPGAAEAQPASLRFAFPAPATSWVNTKGADHWIKEVQAASQGTLEIKLFPGLQLGTVRNLYDRTVAGVVDIAFGTFGELTGQFEKINVSVLPFETKDCFAAATSLWRLLATGVIADEFTKVKVLALFTFPGYALSTTRPVKTVEDLAGLKIITTTRTTAQGFGLLGAAPVSLTPPEIYPAIQRGVAHGTVISWVAIPIFKIEEVTRYDLDTPFGFGPSYFFMNHEVFARLPEAARRAIDAHSGAVLTDRLARACVGTGEEARAGLAARGHEVSDLAPAEVERWKRILAPITEGWVKATPDGANVLAAFRREVASAVRSRP